MGIILESIDFKRGCKVLDIGCGTGDLLIELRNRIGDDYELCGIDTSDKKIIKAKKSQEKFNIKFEKGSIENIQYQDNYFDVILSTFAFHHMTMDVMENGVKEIKRVLKEGGQLLIIDIGKPANLYSKFISLFLRWYEECGTNLHGEVIDILKKNKFEIKFVKNTTRLIGTVNIILAYNI